LKVTALFQNIINYYRTGDTSYLNTVGTTGTNSLLSIANNSYTDLKVFLEKSVILPNTYNDDTAKLFLTILEVFAALRTISTVRKSITNPFVIPDDAVAEYLKSYGFDIWHLFDEGTRRFILADLFNLYKETGTVQGIVDVMKLLGFPSIRVLEHWVEYEDPDYVITSEVVYGVNTAAASALKFFVDDAIIQGDPLWYLTSANIGVLEAAEDWKTPSKTSYFSVLADFDVFGTYTKMSGFLASMIASELAELEESGTITTRKVYSNAFEENLSFLELILAYTFCVEAAVPNGYGWDPTKIPNEVATGSHPAHEFDDGSIEHDDGTAIYDEVIVDTTEVRKMDYTPEITDPDSAFDIIVTDYNNIVQDIEASDYREREQRLADFITKFTSPGNYRIVDNITDKASEKLREINEPFYMFVADKISANEAISAAENILTDIQSYFIAATGLYFQMNPVIDVEKVREAINFIKPYRARPLVISTSNLIKDPWDTFYIHEKLITTGSMKIKCPVLQYDTGVKYDWLVHDLERGEKQPQLHDTSIGYDLGAIFDDRLSFPVLTMNRGLHMDSLKTFDIPFENSNLCNVFSIAEAVKSTGYVVLKKLLYDEYINNEETSGGQYVDSTVLVKMVDLQTFRVSQTQDNVILAQAAYDAIPDDEEHAAEKEAARLVLLNLQALLVYEDNKLLTLQDALSAHGNPKGKLEYSAYDGNDIYDSGSEFRFYDGLILKRLKEAACDNGCFYDVFEATYDQDFIYVENVRII